jgi:hypothetical protein
MTYTMPTALRLAIDRSPGRGSANVRWPKQTTIALNRRDLRTSGTAAVAVSAVAPMTAAAAEESDLPQSLNPSVANHSWGALK